MGTITQTIANNLTTGLGADVSGINFRNIIINGDMSIAQRGTSESGITNEGNTFVIDRFAWQENGGMTSTFTMSQDTDVPAGYGFSKSLKLDCTATDTPATDERLRIQTMFEGQNLQYLKKGTANAESWTLSFWVKSSKTGTYIVNFRDEDNSRIVSKAYTISSASTWEKKTITVAPDTTDPFDNDNAHSLTIAWLLAVGSSLQSGSLADVWQDYANANYAAGQVNFADSTDNNFWITGVQLESGTSASDFEFLPIDVNLKRCQRYYYKWVSINLYNNICIGKVTAVKTARGVYQLPTIMRTSPSLTADGNFRMVAGGNSYGTGSDVSIERNNNDTQFLQFAFSSGTDSTSSQACEMGANNDTDAEIAFSAEL